MRKVQTLSSLVHGDWISDVLLDLLAQMGRYSAARRYRVPRPPPTHPPRAALLGFRIAVRLSSRTRNRLPFEDIDSIRKDLDRHPSRMSEANQYMKSKWGICRRRGRGAIPWTFPLPCEGDTYPGGEPSERSWIVLPREPLRDSSLGDDAVWLLCLFHWLATIRDRDKPTGRPRRKLRPSKRVVFPVAENIPLSIKRYEDAIDELSEYVARDGTAICLTWDAGY